MKRLMIFVAVMCAAMWATAADVPSDSDVRAVGKYVEELTKGDLAQMRQKRITKEQYADALLGYAVDEKKAAAKFALFRDAFKAYADAKSWEKADGVYGAAQVEGGTEYALAVVGHTTIPGAAKDLKARIEGDKKSYRQIGILKSKLKKTPDDESLCESLGQEYAAVGNWDGALASFLTAPGEVAKIADWELNKGGAYTASKVAEFWWGYADGKPKSKMEALRLHAAMWYEIALGEGAYSGNESKIVQGRIDETKSYGGAAMQDKATLAKQVKELKPITLPLNNKTVIEFVGVPAGEFMMGTEKTETACANVPSLVKYHKVTISRPFWLSKCQVTKEQWDSYEKTELTAFQKAVGGPKVAIATTFIEAMDFCEQLTKRFRSKLPKGYVVRLPTEAEWEYAYKIKDSNVDSPYYNWEENISKIAVTKQDVIERATKNSIRETPEDIKPMEVGTKMPNGLGLYDMLGNRIEFTLSTCNSNLFCNPNRNIGHVSNKNQTAINYQDKEIDPLLWCDNMSAWYIMRGGWYLWSTELYGKKVSPIDSSMCGTLRLCIGPDLMKEKGYSFKSGKKK